MLAAQAAVADQADDVLASLLKGELTSVPTGLTIMAGLNCGTPSSLAWPYLRDGLDAAIAVTDAKGAAALAGAEAALTGAGAEARRAALAAPDATVVLICTEGGAANPWI